jgi:DNA-binding response OmpR family regulator
MIAAGNEPSLPIVSQFVEGTWNLICLYSGLASFFFSVLRWAFRIRLMSERILIVEDEADVAELISHHLGKAGFSVELTSDGLSALDLIKSNPPALVILDLMLPQMSGLDLCRAIKGDVRTREVVVLILSARADEIDRVIGFELGADDYVVKPFSPRELVLRIRAIFRRRGSTKDKDDSERIRVGELILDCSRHEVKAANRLVECTATEFKLLRILMERHGRVQGRDRLLSDVWGYDSVIDTRTVDTHMRRLRDKLGDCARYIETVRGFGYRLAIPAR